MGLQFQRDGHHFHSDLQGVRRRSTMKGLGGGGGVGLTYMRIYRVGQPGGGNVCVCGELWTERKRVQTMGASECIVQRWPSILPHLTTCSRTHAHHPSGGRTTPVVIAPRIHPSCVFTDSRVVCHYSCLVLCSCGCRCPWHCVALARSLLSLSAPPVSTTHTRG